MSQNDLVISNQNFPATRADITSALQALGSNNSGPDAPSTTYANMMWYDTTSNLLKIRAEANDAWINIGYLDQSLDTFKILDDTVVTTAAGVDTDGIIGDQTTATWQAGTGTTESLVSPAKVLAAIEENSITKTSGSAPYYGCRAFVFIEDGSDASNTWTGQNIASVVRTAVGAYTITFTTAMPDAEYAVAIGPSSQSSPNNGFGMAIGFTAKGASSFSVRTRRVTDHDIFDCDQMSFSVFT
jgi:hypothetical protein